MADETKTPGVFLDLAESGLVVEQADGGRTRGTPPVLVEKDAACGDCGKRHDMEKCPRCGSWIGMGYGLAGGGVGVYYYCLGDGCDWTFKEFDRE